MAAQDYYHRSNQDSSDDPYAAHVGSSRLPPVLPPLYATSYTPLPHAQAFDSTSPITPRFSHPAALADRTDSNDSVLQPHDAPMGHVRRASSGTFADDIPLRAHQQKVHGFDDEPPLPPLPVEENLPPPVQTETKEPRRRRPRPKQHWARRQPWVVYILSFIQVTVFVVSLVKNALLTGTPIQIHPQINPMIGPSWYLLINMGSRYLPCMKDISSLGLPPDVTWPCPWTTTLNTSDASMQCTLEQLCGFPPLGNPPNQWFRFITPMFLHGGLIHIGFNLLLQLTLGREMERVIGPLRFLLVYVASGIFGFVLGGNFAANGLVVVGASGALFGIIAISLLDLLYKWNERRSPWKELIFIVLDIAISFVLGLMPLIDNFSHIGGFLMGLILGICILHSPNSLRERIESNSVRPAGNHRAPSAGDPEAQHKPAFPTKTGETVTQQAQNPAARPSTRRRRRPKYHRSFFKDPVGFFRGRKLFWWVWWLVRAGALLGALVCFIVLLNNFFKYSNTCSWCKYLSCLNVNNWCDIGNLQSQIINSPANSTSNATQQTHQRRSLGFGAGPLAALDFL